jgi:NAD(P)-dependent dehydrogenase (short-subunit alcohol dehydrogenase family)
MKIIVIGATGTIGVEVAKALSASKHEVANASRNGELKRMMMVAGHPACRLGGGSDAALLVQIMFYHRVFAPLRDPIIDQLETRPSDHIAAPR